MIRNYNKEYQHYLKKQLGAIGSALVSKTNDIRGQIKFGLVLSLILSDITLAQTIYSWNKANSGSWNTQSNCSPFRTTPVTNGFLIFNSGTSEVEAKGTVININERITQSKFEDFIKKEIPISSGPIQNKIV